MEKIYASAHYIALKKYFDKLDEIFKDSIPPLLYPEINGKPEKLEEFVKKELR